MNKDQQDLAWVSLPKEYKEELKRLYFEGIKKRKINRVAIYKSLFGSHNLTSSTESEEMLIVERKKVQEVFINAEKSIPHDTKYNVQGSLHILFGNKCLPDKEEIHTKSEEIIKNINKFFKTTDKKH